MSGHGHPPDYERRDVNLFGIMVASIFSLVFVVGSVLVLDYYFYYQRDLNEKNAIREIPELKAEVEADQTKLNTATKLEKSEFYQIPVEDAMKAVASEKTEKRKAAETK